MAPQTETPNVGNAGAPAAETTLLGNAPAAPTQAPSTEGSASASTEATTTATPAAPEYAFTAPEGQAFDAEVLASYTEVVKEAGIAPEVAQKVLDKVAPVLHARAIAQQAEAARAQREALAEAAKSDPEIGGAKLDATLATAQKALAAVATPALVSWLNESGAGNHPEVIKAFAKLGRLMSTDALVPGGNGNGAATDLASRLFS